MGEITSVVTLYIVQGCLEYWAAADLHCWSACGLTAVVAIMVMLNGFACRFFPTILLT